MPHIYLSSASKHAQTLQQRRTQTTNALGAGEGEPLEHRHIAGDAQARNAHILSKRHNTTRQSDAQRKSKSDPGSQHAAQCKRPRGRQAGTNCSTAGRVWRSGPVRVMGSAEAAAPPYLCASPGERRSGWIETCEAPSAMVEVAWPEKQSSVEPPACERIHSGSLCQERSARTPKRALGAELDKARGRARASKLADSR